MDIFNHNIVAELAWAIGSTPLMVDNVPKNIYRTLDETWCEEQYEMHRDWLLELDQDPTGLMEHLETEHHLLLGKRFEKLLTFWFEQSPHWKLILSGEQLRDGGKTVGEVDYVLEERASGQVFHLEAACKFYLSATNSPGWKSWIGPNGTDSLYEKMTKLDRQLSVFEKPIGMELLHKMRLKKPTSILFLKGYFFHHYSKITTAKGPKYATKKYPSGWYIYAKEAKQFFGAGTHWILLPKSSWLTPFRFFAEPEEIKSAEEMTNQVKATMNDFRRSVLVVQVSYENGFATELSRGFVVRDDWGSL